MPLHGECNCGAVKVTVADQPPERASSITCRCTNCRKHSGAVGSIVLIVPTPDVKIEGELKAWHDTKTDSGKPQDRYFCPNCGCPIVTVQDPSVTIVKMGLFEDIPKPSVEIYMKNKQPWEKSVGVVEFDAAPPSL